MSAQSVFPISRRNPPASAYLGSPGQSDPLACPPSPTTPARTRTCAAKPANDYAAMLYRGCDGCGTMVPLDEWQEGRLGCDCCRTRAAAEAANLNYHASILPPAPPPSPNYRALGFGCSTEAEGRN